ncbi:exodeoxyribonuclease VII small subunit [Ferroacidibacillus organovorans]|uniref:Exodeoxyribonuclease 7 small subunit n=1 Tax=Ferroacidibacillus organovorans TaxID=1765683 RepID=A0A162TPX4_9BACL|nr:exodeoxyribonuclease VII small subunit [Ferroacidibacillus organovorans]KYP81007.1 hypothetical protein AYJ22_09145 [Ferroacidibacillus organovorans]OAG94288.1 hypothetical protein AYW79_06030 [Ferroacidibacillus organovorans]OPG16472.1 exodeoxyribonuclease VII small subunit [Ferroacidibacillus organovorans]
MKQQENDADQATSSSLDEQQVPFESALARLEEVVRMLESGELSLDAALSTYQEGMQLVGICRARLQNAEQRVEQVTSSKGELLRTAFLVEEIKG